MKRLFVFSVKSFIGPFIATLLISIFMLVMQFFWKYIDDLMGKGLGISIIIELIIYVSASLLPLALPLAMLLSSIMTVGNLAEKNELTALKSSGLSLFRILRPLIIICLFISAFTFYFANYVIPIANYKWRALIYDIQETKIAMLLTPGAYSQQIDNYVIKVKGAHNNSFTDVTIHDMSNPSVVKTIKADRGSMYKADTGSAIILKLDNGTAFEENDLNQILNRGGNSNSAAFPQRRYTFESAVFKINVNGFDFKKNDDDLFKNDYEMYNVFQLNEVVDSVVKNKERINRNFVQKSKQSSLFYQLKTDTSRQSEQIRKDSSLIPPKIFQEDAVLLKNLDKTQLTNSYSTSINFIRSQLEVLDSQTSFLNMFSRNLNSYYIEFNRKFALTIAIIILFFIGAPLGAIVRKGGFGAPVVIAALLFMIYFVLISVGDSLADQGVTSPAFGMWMPSVVMLPFAIVLMYSASNDLPINSWTTYRRIFKRKIK